MDETVVETCGAEVKRHEGIPQKGPEPEGDAVPLTCKVPPVI